MRWTLDRTREPCVCLRIEETATLNFQGLGSATGLADAGAAGHGI